MKTLFLLAAAFALAACSSDPGTTDDDAGSDAFSAPDVAPELDAAVDSHAEDAAPPPTIDAGPSSGRQKPISKDATTAPNGFYEYLPPGYDGSAAVPLMVFWHGIGENGDGLYEADGGGDLPLVLKNGPPKLIAANQWPSTRPFIVLSPQHKSDGSCPSAGEIDAFITWATAHYTVDAKRIYLTGLSCGAIGSWSYIVTYESKAVAATLLISGDPGNAWAQDGCGLVDHLAIWSVHGTADPTVAYGPDESEMTNLLACPQPRSDVHWTSVDGGVHDVWTKTYDLSAGYGDVYAWLLANPKP